MTKNASFKREVRARMAATGEKYTDARRGLLERDAGPDAPTLFDRIERRDASPAASEEDSFSFLNRAEGIVWDRIRSTLDAWFAEYPGDDAADLRGRFRSKHAGQHLAAWWELYLHHLFTALGYEIDVHPELPDTAHRPDFLLRRGAEMAYLEAAIVFSGIVDDKRSAVREGWITDAANRGSSPNFYVGIDFRQVGTQRPKDRAIYGPIEKWLAGLDPDQVTADHAQTGEFPEMVLEVDDWSIRFRALPIKREARAQSDRGRLVGMGPVTAGFIDDKEQIRDTLKHKRSRYGNPEVPVVVAINCVGSFPQDEDIAAALYGSIAVQYEENVPGSARTVRLRDGAWISDRGPRGRRMSAVLSGVQLHSHTVVQHAPQLWHNPWAETPLTMHWPFTEWRSSEQGMVDSQPLQPDMAEILSLPREWPGPERPFRT